MLKYLLSVSVFICVTVSYSYAQWTDVINNNINFQFSVQDNYYSGANDNDGQCDPTIRNDFWISANGGSWTGWECYTWDCVAPCYNTNNPISNVFTDKPFGTEIQITAQMFESDNANECQYAVNGIDNDDNYWTGNCTFRNGSIQIPVVYQNTDWYAGAWNPYLGQNGTGWIFPNAGYFNQIWKQVWRYTHGDTWQDPLNFGTLSSGQTVIDVNSNRQPSGANSAMVYTNTGGQPSKDIYYRFTLSESSSVVISTDNPATGFDTWVTLYDQSHNVIAEADQGGTNNTSVLTIDLCPGTYLVAVEGYDNWSGVYELSITASANPLTASVSEVVPTSCPWIADGAITYNAVSGGMPPYFTTWQGTPTGDLTFTGLIPGNTVQFVVTDNCGSTNVLSTIIPDGDETVPVANCVSSITLNVSEGNPAAISISDVDNGSSDNCEIDTYSLSQTSFDVSDAGSNTVTLTVTDDSGNSNNCNTTVIINNTTGIEDVMLANSLNLFPNPTNAALTLQTETELSQVWLTDLRGRKLLPLQCIGSQWHADLTILPAGIYLLEALTKEGTRGVRKVVKQ